MAENLVKLMSSDGYRRLINIILSLKSAQEQEIEKCIKSYAIDTTYQKGDFVIHLSPNSNYYDFLVCSATHISNTTEPNMAFFETVDATQFEGYTEDELIAMLNLSQEELDSLQNILNDTEIQTDHAWSSSKVYTEIINCLTESKKFTIAEVAKIISFSYKVVTSEDEVVDDKAIYLIENATTGTYDMYLYVDNSPSKVGNTNVNLDGYIKQENIVDTFDGTATYTDSDKVFSTKAVKSAYDDLNDKKISKSNIVTTLNDTVTNEQIVGAKTIYDNVGLRHIANYTDDDAPNLDFNNLLEEGIYTFGISTAIRNSPPGKQPTTYGSLKVIKYKNKGYTFIEQLYDYLSSTFLHIYGRRYVVELNEWSDWCKISGTTVPDVPRTELDPSNITKFDSGKIEYMVRNGECHVAVRIYVATNEIGENISVVSGLPPSALFHVNKALCSSGETKGNIYWNEGNSNFYIHKIKDGMLSGTFSYPVAEDWRP